MNETHNFFHQPRAIILSAFIAILLLWILSWESGDNEDFFRKKQLPHAVSDLHSYQFSFDSLMSRMDTYYKTVVDNHSDKKPSRNQLESMLFAFQQERRRFSGHLEQIHKNKIKVSARKMRSLRHYLHSIESIIADLKKRISFLPKPFAKNSN